MTEPIFKLILVPDSQKSLEVIEDQLSQGKNLNLKCEINVTEEIFNDFIEGKSSNLAAIYVFDNDNSYDQVTDWMCTNVWNISREDFRKLVADEEAKKIPEDFTVRTMESNGSAVHVDKIADQ